jgi:hypothetical protein
MHSKSYYKLRFMHYLAHPLEAVADVARLPLLRLLDDDLPLLALLALAED